MRLDGGIITKEDLAKYQPVWREPVISTYRGYTLYTMPPSSSGGVTVTETLNILEGFPTLPRLAAPNTSTFSVRRTSARSSTEMRSSPTRHSCRCR
jgi:gamma-glutamyltranspeptidase